MQSSQPSKPTQPSQFVQFLTKHDHKVRSLRGVIGVRGWVMVGEFRFILWHERTSRGSRGEKIALHSPKEHLITHFYFFAKIFNRPSNVVSAFFQTTIDVIVIWIRLEYVRVHRIVTPQHTLESVHCNRFATCRARASDWFLVRRSTPRLAFLPFLLRHHRRNDRIVSSVNRLDGRGQTCSIFVRAVS